MKALLDLVMWFVKFALVVDEVNKAQPELEEKKAQFEDIIERIKTLFNL